MLFKITPNSTNSPDEKLEFSALLRFLEQAGYERKAMYFDDGSVLFGLPPGRQENPFVKEMFLLKGLEAVKILVSQLPLSQEPILSLVDTMIESIAPPPQPERHPS